MYPHLSTPAVLLRALMMLLSAITCAVVIWYLYQLVWMGQHMPDLALSALPWFQWHDQANALKTVHPAAFALILLAIWLHFERASAHANPGYGWLWALDFLPSAAVFAFLAFTLVKLVFNDWMLGQLRFDDPTYLVIFLVFLGSALSVAYYNLRHWWKERYGVDEERLATIEQVVEAMRQVMGSHSVTLYARPGKQIDPERAYVNSTEAVATLHRLRQ